MNESKLTDKERLELWRAFGDILQVKIGVHIYRDHKELAKARDALYEAGEWLRN